MFNRYSAQVQVNNMRQQFKLKMKEQIQSKAKVQTKKPIMYYTDLRKNIIKLNKEVSDYSEINHSPDSNSSNSSNSSNIKLTYQTQNSSQLKQTEQTFTFQKLKAKIKSRFRPSSFQRVLRHTNQYSFIHILVLFGFYSANLKGMKRMNFIMKNFGKVYLSSALFFSLNEMFYCKVYKYRIARQQPPFFSLNNLAATTFMFPIMILIEGALLIGIKKTLFMTVYSMLMDFKTQVDRFIYLNPHNKFVLQFNEIYRKKSEQQIQNQQKQSQQKKQKVEANQIIKMMVDSNKGQRIANTNLSIILPEVYRYPTKMEKLEYAEKSSKQIMNVQAQRGLNFFTLVNQEQIQKQKEQLLEQQRKQKQQQKSSKKKWVLF